MADLSMPAYADDTTLPADEPSDLTIAIGVAQLLLGSDHPHSLREALRLLLRALDAEPVSDRNTVPPTPAADLVDPTFAAEFPTIAAHLAAERGERR